ncbi:hypothetical protein IM774_08140 [Erysipelotrichaceae bacterium RD49]|nr:hypothetical protein [Erysipelotrichaceae bacterium RD49]
MSENEVLVVLNSSRFGQGNPQLGEKLMVSFLESLADLDAKPRAILLYNSAVVLATDQSAVLPALDTLEKLGVEILVNEQSLTFYNLGGNRKVGQPCDMATMSQRMMNAALIVKP